MPSIKWPADEVKRRKVKDLIPYARNARTHSDEQVSQIAASIREWGFTNPILIDEEAGIIAGHGRLLAAQKLGLAEVPCLTANGWTEAQKKAYVLADNKLALNAGWDESLLGLELKEIEGLGFDLDLIGFSDLELDALMIEQTAGNTDPDDVPDVPDDPVSVPGDVRVLGKHRLICGDCTDADTVGFLSGADLVCTDPPYCSGGFQETGKSVGSVGTAGKHKQIANDRLSTRGYQSLIKTAVFGIPAPFFYVFTDWRMWTYLFDLAESSGAGVRSMIAWNKGTPGMGFGWRSQHELVLWGCRKSPPFAKGFPGIGNVINIPRQTNELHTTQKPVEVMRTLLQGAPFARVVADPFCGSGSTMIACEIEGRDFVGAELDSAYVDTAVKRWQDFTGREATLESTGETFTDVMASRCSVAA